MAQAFASMLLFHLAAAIKLVISKEGRRSHAEKYRMRDCIWDLAASSIAAMILHSGAVQGADLLRPNV